MDLSQWCSEIVAQARGVLVGLVLKVTRDDLEQEAEHGVDGIVHEREERQADQILHEYTSEATMSL